MASILDDPQRRTWLILMFGVPLILGCLFGSLQLGAASSLPLHIAIVAWVGFAFIYWTAFELSGHVIGWLLRPAHAPLLVTLVLAAILGKIVGRPVMLGYGELFLTYLGTAPQGTVKPYSQYGFADFVEHFWNNLPMLLSWIAANLYFHRFHGLARFGHDGRAARQKDLMPTGAEAGDPADVAPHVAVRDQVPASPTGIAALARALPGEIVGLSAEDHYVRVHLIDGRNPLITYRLTTALAELADQDGLQVHRSHWVRRDAVVEGTDLGRSGRLRLKGGSEVTVSHAYLQLARQAGLFDARGAERPFDPHRTATA